MGCDQTCKLPQKNVGPKMNQAHTLLQNGGYSVYQAHILDRIWRATENLFKLLFTVGGEKLRKKNLLLLKMADKRARILVNRWWREPFNSLRIYRANNERKRVLFKPCCLEYNTKILQPTVFT
jgi:hypothetical protein